MVAIGTSASVGGSGGLLDSIDTFVRKVNGTSGPFLTFAALAFLAGVMAAFAGAPWLLFAVWHVAAETWPVGARICFFVAGVSFVVVLLGAVNLFLRLVGCHAFNFTFALPPFLQWVSRHRPKALDTWSGVAAIVIGMLIGETIFT
jgi:hypothetical protein